MNILEIFTTEDSKQWDEIVTGFANFDVYYLSGYVKAFKIHGDGEPQLLYYKKDGLKAIYVYMKRRTAIDGVYDSNTPYGYGGVLFEGDDCIENKKAFWIEYIAKMKEHNIVDNFVRYHPVLANAVPMKDISDVIDLGKTIAFDLSSTEDVWDNIVGKNKNMIRKAVKNGIEIHHAHDYELFKDFIRIYNNTMDRDNAEKYYYFEEEFYKSIHIDLRGHYEIFFATYNSQIVAMSIIIYANNRMHYHLSCSIIEYRNLAPSNLLLYKAALWGCEQGFKTFHLGGGLGSGEDNLYRFKAAFNRHSDYLFSIGKQIFNQEKYDELVAIRASEDINFNPESNFFPLYRS